MPGPPMADSPHTRHSPVTEGGTDLREGHGHRAVSGRKSHQNVGDAPGAGVTVTGDVRGVPWPSAVPAARMSARNIVHADFMINLLKSVTWLNVCKSPR